MIINLKMLNDNCTMTVGFNNDMEKSSMYLFGNGGDVRTISKAEPVYDEILDYLLEFGFNEIIPTSLGDFKITSFSDGAYTDMDDFKNSITDICNIFDSFLELKYADELGLDSITIFDNLTLAIGRINQACDIMEQLDISDNPELYDDWTKIRFLKDNFDKRNYKKVFDNLDMLKDVIKNHADREDIWMIEKDEQKIKEIIAKKE